MTTVENALLVETHF